MRKQRSHVKLGQRRNPFFAPLSARRMVLWWKDSKLSKYCNTMVKIWDQNNRTVVLALVLLVPYPFIAPLPRMCSTEVPSPRLLTHFLLIDIGIDFKHLKRKHFWDRKRCFEIRESACSHMTKSYYFEADMITFAVNLISIQKSTMVPFSGQNLQSRCVVSETGYYPACTSEHLPDAHVR